MPPTPTSSRRYRPPAALRALALSTLAFSTLALVSGIACTSAEEAQAEITGEVEELLGTYLPLLADAYAARELAGLEAYVAPKEIAAIEKRIDDLALQGRTLKPVFREVTVESIQNWSHSNAYVSTVEVWDLEVVSTGSEQVLSEEIGQTNRVKYQLKRDGDRWMVLYRTIVE